MKAGAERYDVVIAGGGTAGLALACALADALGPGARIAVVDRIPLHAGAGPADARAFALSAGAKRMLSALGVWPAVAAHAEPVTAIDITDSSLEDAFRPVLCPTTTPSMAASPPPTSSSRASCATPC